MNARPETSALLAARRATVLVFAIVGVVAQVLTTAAAWEKLTILEVIGTLAALMLVLSGALARRGETGLWILIIGAWLLVLLNILPGAGGAWLLINSAAIFGALAVGLVAPFRLAMLCLVILPFGLHVAWAAHPEAVVATGYAVLGGWVPSMQVATVLLVSALVWRRACRDAAVTDVDFERQELSRERLLAEHARQTARRRTVVRVHATLLNSIKCILDPEPSESTFRYASQFSVSALPQGSTGDNSKSLRDVVTMAIRPWMTRIEVSFRDGSQMRVPATTSEAITSALEELLRNTFRYESDPEVSLTVGGTSTGLVIRLAGVEFPESSESRSIGLRDAVIGSIRDLNGVVAVGRSGLTIDIPSIPPAAATSRRTPGVFVQSRTLMSAALVGMSIGGAPYLLALAFAGGSLIPTVLLVGFTVAIVGILAWLQYRQSRLPVVAAVACVALAAAIPWISILAFGSGCGGMSATLASAMNLSGLMLVAFCMWGNPWLLAPGLATWVFGMGLFLVTAPTQCTEKIPVAILNSILVFPVVVVGVTLSGKAFLKSRAMADHARDLEVTARAAVVADADLIDQLSGLEMEAFEVLKSIGRKSRVDLEDRLALESLDARIRVALQVDPSTDGAMPTLAADLITGIAASGRRINVRGIDHSPDGRPLDPAVRPILERLARGIDPQIGVFYDGTDEQLFLAASVMPDDVPEPGVGGSLMCGDAIVTIDMAPGFAGNQLRVLARVSRPRASDSTDTLVGDEVLSYR